MSFGNVLLLLGAIGLTALLILGGAVAIVFGIFGVLAYGSGALLPIALAGLVSLVGGVAFAFKVVRPSWRLAMGKE